jgi:predicted outer membrane repeat protein
VFTGNKQTSPAAPFDAAAAQSAPGGGAVYSLGDVRIENCTFSSNTADGDGAAIVAGANASVVDSIFETNAAGGNAGAVAVLGRTATFTPVTGTASSTYALELQPPTYTLASTIEACQFSGNAAGADGQGGAMQVPFNAGALAPAITAIRASSFTNNTAGLSGGALAGDGMTITASLFTSNAISSPGLSSDACSTAGGGALFATGQVGLSLSGATFADNYGATQVRLWRCSAAAPQRARLWRPGALLCPLRANCTASCDVLLTHCYARRRVALCWRCMTCPSPARRGRRLRSRTAASSATPRLPAAVARWC